MFSNSRPTYLEINLKALKYNFYFLKNLLPLKTKILAVVKADAYGHGAEKISLTLQKYGVNFFGVASLYEAFKLRQANIKKPILILGYTSPEFYKDLVNLKISQAVFSVEMLNELMVVAKKIKKNLKIHLKVDTGMNRLGVYPNQVKECLQLINNNPYLILEGIFTHYAKADVEKKETFKQLKKFNFCLQENNLTADKYFIHTANSAALLQYKETYFNMVRAGLSLYGISPIKKKFSLQPVLSLKTKIISIKNILAGEGVSYEHIFIAKKNSKIAVIPIGYADGYLRGLSNCGEVLVNSQKIKIVGMICMDFSLIDVTDIKEVAVGDEVVIIGRQGNKIISADSIAKKLHTISYEVTCLIGRRVQRKYISRLEDWKISRLEN